MTTSRAPNAPSLTGKSGASTRKSVTIKGDDDDSADGQTPDAAVLRRQERGAVPQPLQQSAGSESGELEHRKPQRIECGELFRSNGAREAEHGPTENEHDLHRPGGMAAQDAFGDDQGAERHQRGRQQGKAIEPCTSGPPRHAAHEKQHCRHAQRNQQAPCQGTPGIAPVERHHGDAQADGAAQVDDGIGDNSG